MINYELILEILTAAAAAFIAYRQHNQVKAQLKYGELISPLLPVVSEGRAATTAAPAQSGSKKERGTAEIVKTGVYPINVKAQLDDCASRGVPFDMTPYGAGATLNITTGDITYDTEPKA